MRREGFFISRIQVICAVITVGAALIGLCLAYRAYDIGLQQLKDMGSWVVVKVVDFHYIRQGQNGTCGPKRIDGDPDTIGCFVVTITNRLSADVRKLKLNYRVPPQDWMSHWIWKAGLQEAITGEYNIPNRREERIGITLPIAVDPENYYCAQRNPFEFHLHLRWKDDGDTDYETTRGFRVACVRTNTGQMEYDWIPLPAGVFLAPQRRG